MSEQMHEVMSETESIRQSVIRTQARLLELEQRVVELEAANREHTGWPCERCMPRDS